MGSVRFDGVRFILWSHDHPPPHVHGSYADIEIVVDLLVEERAVRLSFRKDAKRPNNARRSDVNHILSTASEHFEELLAMWTVLHGKS